MSSLNRTQRAFVAAEKFLEALEIDAYAADADAGFDAGEFSGPAHDRMMQREQERIAASHCVSVDDIEREVMLRQYGDDPMGEWMGRNE